MSGFAVTDLTSFYNYYTHNFDFTWKAPSNTSGILSYKLVVVNQATDVETALQTIELIELFIDSSGNLGTSIYLDPAILYPLITKGKYRFKIESIGASDTILGTSEASNNQHYLGNYSNECCTNVSVDALARQVSWDPPTTIVTGYTYKIRIREEDVNVYWVVPISDINDDSPFTLPNATVNALIQYGFPVVFFIETVDEDDISIGFSPYDYESNFRVFTGNTVPGAPTNIQASPGLTNALVSWTPPTSTGGSAITGYRVFSNPDNKLVNTAAASATSLLVTGLKNATPYTFAVVAINAVGSSYSATTTPSTLPGAPKVTAVRGNASATLTWTHKPAVGAPTTSFNISANPSAGVTIPPNSSITTNPTGAKVLTVTGLTNGTSYVFSVSCVNVIGTSLPGLAKPVIPATVPGAPTGVTAIAATQSAQVSWTAPVSNGGSAITGYSIVYTTGGVSKTMTAKATPTTALIKGLINGTAYTITVASVNVLGASSTAELTGSVTPAAVPAAPVVTAALGSRSVTLTWAAPASNGAAITSYTVTSAPALPVGSLPETIASPLTISNLDAAVTYTLSVVARNSVGASAPSKAVKAKPNA